jgi:hypothetical protein
MDRTHAKAADSRATARQVIETAAAVQQEYGDDAALYAAERARAAFMLGNAERGACWTKVTTNLSSSKGRKQ